MQTNSSQGFSQVTNTNTALAQADLDVMNWVSSSLGLASAEDTQLISRIQDLPLELFRKIKKDMIEMDLTPFPRTMGEYLELKNKRMLTASSDPVLKQQFRELFFNQTVTVTVSAKNGKVTWHVDDGDLVEPALLERVKNMRLVLAVDWCEVEEWSRCWKLVTTTLMGLASQCHQLWRVESLDIILLCPPNGDWRVLKAFFETLTVLVTLDAEEGQLGSLRRCSIVLSDGLAMHPSDVHLESRLEFGQAIPWEMDEDTFVRKRVVEAVRLAPIFISNGNRRFWLKSDHSLGDTSVEDYLMPDKEFYDEYLDAVEEIWGW
ncbi:hypothetical protein H2203_003833 [Taxawa tesnikishii (nom. ined.)]|nr:hypothetical protein H2203_003833 [Dothideales sp. JES 119]